MRDWNQPTVLIVEDEDSVLKVVELMMMMEGYSVLAARNEEEAVETVRGHLGKVDLLLADVKLRRGSGPSVSSKLRRLNPGMKTVYMSGYLKEDLLESGLIRDDELFLSKPIDMPALRSLVRGRYSGESSWSAVR